MHKEIDFENAIDMAKAMLAFDEGGEWVVFNANFEHKKMHQRVGSMTIKNAANAYDLFLTSTAPDMYRALRDLVDNGKIFFDDDYADARAALAKADGEQG